MPREGPNPSRGFFYGRRKLSSSGDHQERGGRGAAAQGKVRDGSPGLKIVLDFHQRGEMGLDFHQRGEKRA